MGTPHPVRESPQNSHKISTTCGNGAALFGGIPGLQARDRRFERLATTGQLPSAYCPCGTLEYHRTLSGEYQLAVFFYFYNQAVTGIPKPVKHLGYKPFRVGQASVAPT
jgi:hypothetical protein